MWIVGHRQNEGEVDGQALLLVNLYSLREEVGQSVAPPQASWLVPAGSE